MKSTNFSINYKTFLIQNYMIITLVMLIALLIIISLKRNFKIKIEWKEGKEKKKRE